MDKDDNTAVMGFWRIVLVVVMCIFGWFAYTWLAFDVRTAGALESSLPGWFIAVPVVIWVLGWIVLGLGTFIFPRGRERMRLRSAPTFWIVSCIIGCGVVVFGLIAEPGTYRIGGILTAGGLILLALILVMLLSKYPRSTAALFSHILSTLLFVGAFLISAGMQQGFVYRFPILVLGSASFLFFVTGCMEILAARPGFTRLACLLRKKPCDTQPATSPSTGAWWKFHGAVMALCGVFFFGVLINNTFAIVPDTVEDTSSVMLNIPVGAAWTWFAEPSHFILWNTDFTEYIIPEITYEREGSVYYLVGERNEKGFTLQCIITKWDEPREYSFVGRCEEFDVYGSYLIEPADNGSYVTCREIYSFRNLRETITAAISGWRSPLQSLEERMTILREVAGAR